mmetsp:Transcript_28833/g.85948  ORF Transcript_28833/g.85948 Transcript_28833/m.85948 type:complete len:330 (+) Transcript_28833:579-1568(+)
MTGSAGITGSARMSGSAGPRGSGRTATCCRFGDESHERRSSHSPRSLMTQSEPLSAWRSAVLTVRTPETEPDSLDESEHVSSPRLSRLGGAYRTSVADSSVGASSLETRRLRPPAALFRCCSFSHLSRGVPAADGQIRGGRNERPERLLRSGSFSSGESDMSSSAVVAVLCDELDSTRRSALGVGLAGAPPSAPSAGTAGMTGMCRFCSAVTAASASLAAASSVSPASRIACAQSSAKSSSAPPHSSASGTAPCLLFFPFPSAEREPFSPRASPNQSSVSMAAAHVDGSVCLAAPLPGGAGPSKPSGGSPAPALPPPPPSSAATRRFEE